MSYHQPRVIISGLSGGSGKTLLSLGIARALLNRGLRIQTFKKGPDYIDTLWLSLAGNCNAYNLDPFLVQPEILPDMFIAACSRGVQPDLAIIEGNRGLFDGQDIHGSASTARLARELKAPVILVLNCTKMTRTAAALVHGCKTFETDLQLAGVILNNVNRSRHQEITRSSIEELVEVPVLGALPRFPEPPLVERQDKLEAAVLKKAEAFESLDRMAELAEKYVNLDSLLDIARAAPDFEEAYNFPARIKKEHAAESLSVSSIESISEISGIKGNDLESFSSRPRIGYVRDQVLWYYYTENLDALVKAGAELIELSILSEAEWPELDGLYLGGGQPELYVEQFADNQAKQRELFALIESGLPVYAEGSGFYYLAEEIKIMGKTYPMCGIFGISLELGVVPHGIGYVQAVVEGENPFHPIGTELKAHEFHYMRSGLLADKDYPGILRLSKGTGLFSCSAEQTATECSGRDGLLYQNCFAAHLQIYAPGVPHWARGFVQAAKKFRAEASKIIN